MSHTVGSQQQSLNAASSGTSGAQILSPAQAQSTADTFYSTTTPPQDINQPPTVDALAASLGMWSIFSAPYLDINKSIAIFL